MPCFNPENVIFITNKWDSLNTNNTDEDSSDDDEETKVWENKIKRQTEMAVCERGKHI